MKELLNGRLSVVPVRYSGVKYWVVTAHANKIFAKHIEHIAYQCKLCKSAKELLSVTKIRHEGGGI